MRCVEASIADATPTPCTALVSVHACGDLSDLVLKLAAEARSPVAVVPCCHRGLSKARAFAERLNAALADEGTGGSGPSPICPSAAMDVARLELLRRAGFHVHARTIPREITPKNRVIVGAVAAAAAAKTIKTTRTARLPVGAPSRTRYRRVRGSGTSSGRSDVSILANTRHYHQ